MYSSILLIILNILCIYLLNKKYKNKNINEYSKEKIKFYKKKLKSLISTLNISYLLIYICYFILLALNNTFKMPEICLFIVNMILYTTLLLKCKIGAYNGEIINKVLIGKQELMILLPIILIMTVEKINNYELSDIIMIILSILILISSVVIVILFFIENRGIIVYNVKEENYIQDIKFNNRIQVNKIFNAFIYIFAYIVFAYIRIPFQYLIYILIGVLLIIVINNKIKKITYQSDKLYKSVYIKK